MLETPLFGKFVGEDRRLIFGPPLPYQVLVKGCLGVGGVMVAYFLVATATGMSTPLYPTWWFFVGSLIILAGILAMFSLQSITFDLRERFYVRRQGPGFFPRVTKGPLSNLDAVVCIAEPNSRMIQGGVTYHLVLYWKGQAEPLMVLQQDTRQIPHGQPLNIASTQLLERGARYAKAMGLPYHDNTHFASPCPISVWQ